MSKNTQISETLSNPQNFSIVLDGVEQPLSTTLRVMYKFQGYNNHEPYMALVTQMDKLPIEQQISFLYCAATVADDTLEKRYSRDKFINSMLDNPEVNGNYILTRVYSIINKTLGINSGVVEDGE